MKKRLVKTMPHVPLLKLRPELREQNEVGDDPDHPQDTVDNVDMNAEGANEAYAAERDANTTFHDLRAGPTGAKYGLVQRVKRFISKRKANGGNIVAGRTGLGRADNNNNIRYGDDESSESDNEGDQHDGIPLVRRIKRK